VVRRRQVAAALLTTLVVTVLVVVITGVRGDRSAPAQAQGAAVSRVAPAGQAATVNSTEDRTTTSAPAVAPSTAAKSSTPKVVQRGAGTLAVVPGSSKAPGRGPVQQVRVEVERGIGENGRAFADVVMATLNDPRSWGHGGSRTFARTDGPADIRVILASPDTSSSLCRPLVTKGTLSCSVGDKAIITAYRWALATPEFPNLGVYRQYVVNHEVGHVLGKGHERCPGPGRLAPLMQQQTIKVAPCKPNAWPHP
jgi:hypothetical protein